METKSAFDAIMSLEDVFSLPFGDLSFVSCQYNSKVAEMEMRQRHKDDRMIVDYDGAATRLNFSEYGGVELIQGIPEHFEPDYHIIHDYAPSLDYIRGYQTLYTTTETVIPYPFDPKAERWDKERTGYVDSVVNICKAFDLTPTCIGAESDPKKNDFIGHPPGSSTTQAVAGVVFFAFNPFCSAGRSMIEEINRVDSGYEGKYKSVSRVYDFTWLNSHGGYVVNPDVWIPLVKTVTPFLRAFSLVFPNRPSRMEYVTATIDHTEYVVPPAFRIARRGSPYDVGSLDPKYTLKEQEKIIANPCFRIPGITYDFQISYDYVVEVEFVCDCDLEQSEVGDIRMGSAFKRDMLEKDILPEVTKSPVPWFDVLKAVDLILNKEQKRYIATSDFYSTAVKDGSTFHEIKGKAFRKFRAVYSPEFYYVLATSISRNRNVFYSEGKMYLRLTDFEDNFIRNIQASSVTRNFLSPFSFASCVNLSSEFEVVMSALLKLNVTDQLLIEARNISENNALQVEYDRINALFNSI